MRFDPYSCDDEKKTIQLYMKFDSTVTEIRSYSYDVEGKR